MEDFIKKYWLYILAVVVVIVVVVSGISGYNSWQNYKNKQSAIKFLVYMKKTEDTAKLRSDLEQFTTKTSYGYRVLSKMYLSKLYYNLNDSNKASAEVGKIKNNDKALYQYSQMLSILYSNDANINKISKLKAMLAVKNVGVWKSYIEFFIGNLYLQNKNFVSAKKFFLMVANNKNKNPDFIRQLSLQQAYFIEMLP